MSRYNPDSRHVGGVPTEPNAAALDLRSLRLIAEAATPGPWMPYETIQADNYVTAGGGLLTGTVICGPTYERQNVAHIAAFDPTTVLALLDRLDEAERHAAHVESNYRDD